MASRNIDLTDHYEQFVDDQVASGRFANASEVMRAGLRLLEKESREDEQRLAVLRSLAKQGLDELDQGQGVRIEDEAGLRGFMDQVAGRIDSKTANAMRV